MKRRSFLGSAAATAALCALGSRAAGNDGKRFVFVHAEGGWDPLCVFAPLFGRSAIDMEEDAAEFSVGGLSLVDSPQRPVTRAFFERHHQQTLVLNGVSTRSVNHETCQLVALTGGTSEDRPDWATLLARSSTTDLPHLVVSGPAFPGPLQVLVSRAEGQLQQTLDGSLLGDVDDAEVALVPAAGRVVDRFLARRAAAVGKDVGGAFGEDVVVANARARALLDRASQLSFSAAADTRERMATAVGALRDGVSRCVSLGTDFIWDTHNNNEPQTPNFERLFGDLDALLALLATTRGSDGVVLADNTVVVVTSEMARTPRLNGSGGRDHWPVTSMMIIGPGITGSRQIGAYTDLYAGVGVDVSGELDVARPGIPAASVGATLLALGDVDPKEALPNAEPILGVLT